MDTHPTAVRKTLLQYKTPVGCVHSPLNNHREMYFWAMSLLIKSFHVRFEDSGYA